MGRPKPPKRKPKVEDTPPVVVPTLTFLAWPPGTEPEDKLKWRPYAPTIISAVDEANARRILKAVISDADDWEIEQAPKKFV